ncbi:MAG: hypothetical protein ACJ797_09355 [Ktedonobacteraceae bacterium]|jgi:hypothetical protein
MRWVVQYQSQTGSIGLMIFSTEDEAAAQVYVTEMVTKRGYKDVSKLSPFPSGAGVDELYRLFPRLASITKREGAPPTRRHS